MQCSGVLFLSVGESSRIEVVILSHSVRCHLELSRYFHTNSSHQRWIFSQEILISHERVPLHPKCLSCRSGETEWKDIKSPTFLLKHCQNIYPWVLITSPRCSIKYFRWLHSRAAVISYHLSCSQLALSHKQNNSASSFQKQLLLLLMKMSQTNLNI